MTKSLSILVVFHEMQREAPRTLLTLSPEYQNTTRDYRVIAVDNGSRIPLPNQLIDRCRDWLTYLPLDSSDPSPVGALNAALEVAETDYIVTMIDGARMASPGLVEWTFVAMQSFPRAIVCTSGFHLGHKLQGVSRLYGYDQDVEDALLAQVPWQEDGYRLFEISTLASSSGRHWFDWMTESNYLACSRPDLDQIRAYDRRFRSPGGGLFNLHLHSMLLDLPRITPVKILGEGTFHQFHGGVATNALPDEHPWDAFHEEYVAIVGEPYRRPMPEYRYIGHMPPGARRFLVAGTEP